MHIISGRACAVAVLLAAALAVPTHADELAHPNTFTIYSGRISAEETWHVRAAQAVQQQLHRLLFDRGLVHARLPRTTRWRAAHGIRGQRRVQLRPSGLLELNVAPITLRWQRFPWDEHFRSSIAFGLGLSYAFEYPEIEYELENDTKQLLLFWQLELTAGPREGPWSAVLRLHHRSPGWGAMGVSDGGMNAPSLGFRYAF